MDPELDAILTGAFESVAEKIISVLIIITPIAVSIIGISVSIVIAVKVYKKLISKAG